MSDLWITNGTLVDGRGAPRFRGHVRVRDGRIAEVTRGAMPRAAGGNGVLAADGLAVAPGFIDIHTHDELALLANPAMPCKTRQGVTTVVLGNCGFSAAPLHPETMALQREVSAPIFGHGEVEWDWGDLGGYFGRLERHGCAVNAASLVGHGALRAAVMGFARRAPAAAELEAMQRRLAACLEAGALGLSTGLVYPPGCYAETAELVALARAMAPYGGWYATHLRDQADRLPEAVKEALAVGAGGDVPVHISHHKCSGRANFGRVRDSLALLDGARSGGEAPGSDMYPYLAGSSTLVSLFPPWSLEGGVQALLERLADGGQRAAITRAFATGLPGWENRIGAVGWENILVSAVDTGANQALVGRSLADIARARGRPPESVIAELVEEERGRVGYIGYNSSEADLETMMRHPRTSVGSDGLDVGERPHPRLYGTFPRILGEYVRRRGVLSLEAAVYRMTGLPAAQARLEGIGRIAPGCRADLVLFDPETVADLATFADPRQYPLGIPHVLNGGTAVVRDGRETGALPGRVLRRARAA